MPLPTHLLNAALEYARQGFQVFPCGELSKEPRISAKDGGKGCHDSTCDESKIRNWWGERWPNANVALSPAPGTWFALDVDGEAGIAELAKFEAIHGALPATLTQNTPSGGKHFLFHVPTGVKIGNKVGFAPNLDTRSEGGYVLCQPSSTEKGQYTWLNRETAIADPPAWLITLIVNASVNSDGERKGFVLPDEIHEGQGRNNAIYTLTCSLMRTYNRDTARVREMVTVDNQRICKPPLPVNELDASLESAFNFFKSGKADINKQYDRAMKGALETERQIELKQKREEHAKHTGLIVGWLEMTTKKRDGFSPMSTHGTASLMLKHSPDFHNSLALNEFTNEIHWTRNLELYGGFKIVAGERLRDIHHLKVMKHAEITIGIVFDKTVIEKAISDVAEDAKFHPVRDYLKSLPAPEAGKPSILDTWLTKYMHVADTPITRAFGRKFLISSVARIMKPGCQVDSMLVLEGVESGESKTSAIKHLYGDALVGQGPKRLSDKDDLMKLRGVWCLEMEEMSHMRRSELEEIKAFLTGREDRYRSPYGRSVETFKRQCVFIGTTNNLQYLEDDQNRRYWPVTVQRKISEALRAELEAARDQIWAEAYSRYQAGEKWWFADDEADLIKLAKEEQAARRLDDPWQELIEAYLRGRSEASVQAIFSEVLRIDTALQNAGHTRRLANCLKVAGWKKAQVRKPSGRVWLYIPKDAAVQASFLDTTPLDPGEIPGYTGGKPN